MNSSNGSEIRNTLDILYNELYSTDNKEKKSSITKEIDAILSQAYEVKPLLLFINRMRGKAFYSSIMKVVNNEIIDDYELSLGLSSLITHALIEMKKSNKSFFELHIPELSRLLEEYLNGQIFQDYIRDYLRKLMY